MSFNGFLFFILVLIFSGVNNYLLAFAQSGKLPASVGFNLFAKAAHICIATMSIWNLGWIMGIVFFLLYLFNFLNASYSWIITYSLTAKNIKNGIEPELNMTVYGFFSFFILLIVIYTIVCLFAGSFENIKYNFEETNYSPLIVFTIVGIIGFIARIALMRKLSKNY